LEYGYNRREEKGKGVGVGVLGERILLIANLMKYTPT
jgi:hypothetical protein